MRKLLALLLLLSIGAAGASAAEVTLFNQTGEAAAYIDTNRYIIYLWNGTPSAYFLPSFARNSLAVYGFNGKLLGWYVDGAVYDKTGKVSGFEKGKCPLHAPYTRFEPYKGAKRAAPAPSAPEVETYQPYLQRSWGKDLSLLLKGGR